MSAPARHRLLAAALLAAVLLAAGPPAAGAEAQWTREGLLDPRWIESVKDLHPYAALAYSDDSNLLRRPDLSPARQAELLRVDLSPAAYRYLTPQSDRFLTVEAGLDTTLKLGRQRLHLDGRVFRNYYDRFSEFDYTGGNASLVLDWLVGRLWEGALAYRFDHDIRDFANQDLPRKDMRSRSILSGSVNRWLTTRWRAGAQASWADISFTESPLLEKTRWGTGLHVERYGDKGSWLGLAATYDKSSFDRGDDRDYADWSAGLRGEWKVTEKSSIRANAGWKTRRHDRLDERDYDGFVGELYALWQITAKTSLAATLWRDLSTLDDQIANYAAIDGLLLEPVWNIGEKLSVRAVGRLERRDFEGNRGLGAGLSQALAEDLAQGDRVDDLAGFAIQVEWRPRDTVALTLGWEAEDRDSNRELYDYDYRAVRLGIRIGL